MKKGFLKVYINIIENVYKGANILVRMRGLYKETEVFSVKIGVH